MPAQLAPVVDGLLVVAPGDTKEHEANSVPGWGSTS